MNIFGASSNLGIIYAERFLAYYESPSTDVQCNWTRGSFGNYDLLRQINDMDFSASGSGDINYKALAKFFRVVCYIQLTETFVDIPYSQSMQALEGITKPKCDAQKDVYVGCLASLEKAAPCLIQQKGFQETLFMATVPLKFLNGNNSLMPAG
ncbi:MAG TPA: SusD/RagB family nutrient-binding outer membrane lipoprotein [Puia sp.]|nr:SusD/RagB family nutrient-binding outer membrane lipoprotein [Puia sp.]